MRTSTPERSPESRRVARLRRSLVSRKLDAFLVTQPENRRYLSGFTGQDHSINETAGVLLIPAHGEPWLLTDGRYLQQAEAEAAGFRVKLYHRGLFASLRRLFLSLEIRRLGFESHYFLHSSAITLEKETARKGIELVPLVGLVERLRLVKTKEEVRKITAALKMAEEVFQQVYAELAPGMREKEVAWRIETEMVRRGADSPSFETIVASGPNSALPHAVPTDREIREGEPVIIDMGVKLDGYCSDITRTVVLGRPERKVVEMIRLVRKAQLAGLAALRAGVSGNHVDRVAREVIERAGLGERFCHGLGHGVGLNVHEGPSLSYRNRKQLDAGMVVTVEPGVYIPGWGGVRLENMAVVEPDGCRVLNQDSTFLDI